ncbi:MAG: hypothetical protein ACYSX0_09025 [Planctomycetota bacterium]
MEAAAPFERILVRVPEAYLLVSRFKATRPGLLVLDADGRRVDAIKIDDAGAVAARLKTSLRKQALEEFVVEGAPTTEEMARASSVAPHPKGTRIVATAGAFTVETLRKRGLRIVEPVEVRLTPARDADGARVRLLKVAGVWWVEGRKELRAYVSPLLLLPAPLLRAAPGATVDIEARSFDLPDVPKGGRGWGVASAPLLTPGVLSIFPDIFGESQRVVGRKGEISWKAVRDAFAKSGCKARPSDESRVK